MSLEITDTGSVSPEVVPEVSPAESDAAALMAEGEEPEVVEEEPAKPKEKKVEPPKSNKKKFKLKVNGKEFDEEVDLDDEEYIVRELQKSKAFTQKAQEEAELRKTFLNLIEEIKKNPKKVLSDPNIGVDIKKLAAEIIEEEIENAQKSPEQLEKERLEARLRELEDERKKEKEDAKARELAAIEEKEFHRYDTLISKALEESQLPKTPYVVKKITDYLVLGLQNQIKLDPADVMPLVKDEMMADIKEMFDVLPADVVKEMIGKKKFDEIRKSNIAKAKEKPPVPIKSAIKDAGSTGAAKSAQPERKLSIRELFGA